MVVDQVFINWTLAALGGMLGFFLKVIWQSVSDLRKADKELAKQVSSIEVLVVGDYVKKSDFLGIFTKLDRIEDKLDKKADK